jgi:hypothetical protein
VARRAFESIWHGTYACILSRHVVTGQMVAPSGGPSRTEAECLAQVQAVVASDPTATRGHFVIDNLDIHRSVSLVRSVAIQVQLELDLGEKDKCDILANRQSRAAFLATRVIECCFTRRRNIGPG